MENKKDTAEMLAEMLAGAVCNDDDSSETKAAVKAAIKDKFQEDLKEMADAMDGLGDVLDQKILDKIIQTALDRAIEESDGTIQDFRKSLRRMREDEDKAGKDALPDLVFQGYVCTLKERLEKIEQSQKDWETEVCGGESSFAASESFQKLQKTLKYSEDSEEIERAKSTVIAIAMMMEHRKSNYRQLEIEICDIPCSANQLYPCKELITDLKERLDICIQKNKRIKEDIQQLVETSPRLQSWPNFWTIARFGNAIIEQTCKEGKGVAIEVVTELCKQIICG